MAQGHQKVWCPCTAMHCRHPEISPEENIATLLEDKNFPQTPTNPQEIPPLRCIGCVAWNKVLAMATRRAKGR